LSWPNIQTFDQFCSAFKVTQVSTLMLGFIASVLEILIDA
jgi:hypothetical protein